MKKTKRSTFKNWLEVLLLVVLVVVITIYLCSWYKNYKQESMNEFVLGDLIKQIKYEELDPYLQENNDVYVYICVIDDTDCREFETDIKDTIESHDLKDYIVYLNLTEEENREEIIDDINAKYGSEEKIDDYPAFVRIKDSKIVSMVEKVNKKLTKSNFERYMDLNEMN